MIDCLCGKIIHLENESIVIDVQGVGYRVFTPHSYVFAKLEGQVTIFTHHYVRTDYMQLFGFRSRKEQKLFCRLIEVNGVGPKVALAILAGGGTAEAIVAAIQQENISFLVKLQGVGKKTAQRIILDLKDKLVGIGGDVCLPSLNMEEACENDVIHAWGEARQALKKLGYTELELERAKRTLQQYIDANESVDALMRRALQVLFTS